MVRQRPEQEVHFGEVGVTPAALPGSNPSNPVPTATGDTGGAGGEVQMGTWHDLALLLQDSSRFNKPWTVSAAPCKSMLESTSFRPVNC